MSFVTLNIGHEVINNSKVIKKIQKIQKIKNNKKNKKNVELKIKSMAFKIIKKKFCDGIKKKKSIIDTALLKYIEEHKQKFLNSNQTLEEQIKIYEIRPESFTLEERCLINNIINFRLFVKEITKKIDEIKKFDENEKDFDKKIEKQIDSFI
jgi:hypothetical protein